MRTASIESGAILLEREDELATISACLDRAERSDGALLLIEGPAGIGKTELLRAARERADERGIEVLDARGGELERSLAFGIARQLFEPRLARADDDERRELLAGAASLAGPALGLEGRRQSGVTAAPLGDPAAAIHHGLYWLCANLAERSPLLLLVDDLHWADPASARWLLYLERRVGGLPVSVIAAIRPGEPDLDPTLLASLAMEPAAQVLRPEALSEEGTGRLVRAELGEGAEASFCSACHAATGGNPFLLGELLEAVRRDGIQPTARSAAAIEKLAPETIARSTLLRIARLPAGAGPLARAVAVLGAQAEPRHAAKLAGLAEEEAAAASDALAAASLLLPERPLRFAHPVLRAAIYEQIPGAERARAHRGAARMLADEGGGPEEVAAHLLHADPAGEEWEVPALTAAAAAAIDRGAPDAAILYLRRALEDPTSSARRLELLSSLLDAGVAAGQPAILEEVSNDPIGELTATPQLLVDSVLRLGMWLFTTARFDEANEAFDRAIAEVRDAARDDLALRFEMQRLSVIPVRARDALARLQRYADLVRPGTPEERLWLAQRALWTTATVSGSAEACTEIARRALAHGRIFSEQVDTASVGQAILVLIWADELAEAESWIDYGADDARRRGSQFGFSGMVGLRSQLAYRQGDIPAAVENARAAIAMAREAGNLLSLPVQASWLTDAMVERGELAEAEGELEGSGFSGKLPDHWWFSPLRFSRAALRLATGKAEEALADLRLLAEGAEAGEPAPALYPVFATTALALNALDRDREEQRRLTERELARARGWGTPRVVGVALRAKGLVEGGEDGVGHLRESVDVLASSPARLEHARALTDLGAALRRVKKRREAREPLKEALDLATRCGAGALAERARQELAATGAKPRRVMLTGVESLTPSELRIARMAADGMTNKEIAQALFVTVKTVEMHLGHVYRKLHISSRRELLGALAS